MLADSNVNVNYVWCVLSCVNVVSLVAAAAVAPLTIIYVMSLSGGRLLVLG